MKTRYKKTAGLVLGMVLLALLARPTAVSVAAGSLLVLIGECIRIWAAGHLRRKKELTLSGPYAYVRDPLYLGRFFLIIGFCIMGWGYSLVLLPVALGIFFLNYIPRKHKKEMAWLGELFGEQYTHYAACTRSLIPRLTPYERAGSRRWNFQLLWQENREQYFLLIVAAVWTALFLKHRALM